MKKKISILILLFTIMNLLLLALSSCTKDAPNKDEPVYQQGYIQGADIYDQFECIGTKQSKTFFGGNGTKTVYCQQTATGGWVAWTARRYIYTEQDVGAEAIFNKAMVEFMTSIF